MLILLIYERETANLSQLSISNPILSSLFFFQDKIVGHYQFQNKAGWDCQWKMYEDSDCL